MSYNDILIKIVNMLKEEKYSIYLKNNILNDLLDVLFLENILSNYLDNYNNLTEFEVENFLKFSVHHKEIKNRIIKKYEKMYDDKIISNEQFLKNYNTIHDYICALILNSYKEKILDKEFLSNLSNFTNHLYSTDSNVIKSFKDISLNYKKLFSKSQKINDKFKASLKEYEILEKVHKTNDFLSISYYILISKALDFVSHELKIKDLIKNLNNKLYLNEEDNFDTIGEYKKNINTIKQDNFDLSKFLLTLSSKKNWYDNTYMSLILEITNSDSEVCKLLEKNISPILLGLFVYYLQDNTFRNIVYNNEKKKFNNMDNLINKILEINYKDDSRASLDKLFESMNNLYNDVITGKLLIGKTKNKGGI